MKTSEALCQHPGGLELTRRGLLLCDFPPGGPIVDVGCGAGATVKLLRDLGYEALGLDTAPPGGADFPIIKGRAESLPFAPESLSGLVCECALCLCDDREATLAGFWRVCRPGAFLLLSDIYDRGAALPAFGETGWQAVHFEDHSRALLEYAAQSLWRGEEDTFRAGGKNLGYGLWVARKR